ncbi:hypothetical protein PVA38_10670 [Streptococcus pneumoniae D39]|nr:hypothetical protein PVA38_10670 [Streptococcus pneumoniae D39]
MKEEKKKKKEKRRKKRKEKKKEKDKSNILLNDTATTEIYTSSFVGSVRCV